MSATSEPGSTQAAFVHLRVHSAYSLLEGALHIKRLAALCREHGMPALALTDTGNMFGALEFSETLARAGIQPIAGLTLALDFDEDTGDAYGRGGGTPQRRPTIAVLAKDKAGYANLLALSTASYFCAENADTLAVTPDLLRTHAEGLIALTGGPDGPVDRAIAEHRHDLAGERLKMLREAFGDRLYVELQRHDMAPQHEVEPVLLDLAYKHDLPLVATNEPYFETPDDFEAHDALICIAESVSVDETDRRQLTPSHYFTSQDEMVRLFADLPEAIHNTIEIARRCAFRPMTCAPILPAYKVVGAADDPDFDEAAELRRQAEEGLTSRLQTQPLAPGHDENDYRERLAYELDVIANMKFPGYFLIVADFIKWAKSHDIPVGPGRGSGAGSVVAWALTITDLDPLRFGLLFERFLNPERVSMPDFDIDFCQDRRDEVIHYVRDKFGADQVAHIITFGKLQARAVLRDVGRVLGLPYGQVDRLCKLIPNNPADPTTLEQAIGSEPRLREARDEDEAVGRMLAIALRLEGLYRHASTHAAGIVIGDRPLKELVPLYRDPRSDMPVTQFSMKWAEEAGLVKFDFLGLKTLTVIDTTIKMLQRRGVALDLATLTLEDEATYDMLSKGETVGVFQLESSGMRDALKKLKPDRFEDIIAMVALYRPGPMANIETYVNRKKGTEKADYLHPKLEPILKETHGVIIYQEQVMEIARVLSGYSLGEADLLRRAMGKKIQSEMDQQKERFVSGALERDVDCGQAEFIFELVNKFAGYGFNKSHAAAYALVAYQTAYLKATYPCEFLAASMTLDMGNTDKLYVFKQELDRLDIALKAPSINASEAPFTVEDDALHYSLAALKNVGRHAVDHIVELRAEGGPFTDLADFSRRVNPKVLNRRALESLVRAGAFDALNDNRAALLAGVDLILATANRSADAREQGQDDLFGGGAANAEALPLPDAEPWLPMDRLSEEFEAIGFYLSGHPLDDHQAALQRISVTPWRRFADKVRTGEAQRGKLAATVSYRQERRSRNGNRFAFIGFSDPTGQFEAVVFADTLGQARDLLEPGSSVVVQVDGEAEGSDVRLRVHAVEALDDAIANVATGLKIFLDREEAVESVAARLEKQGRSPVRLVLPVDEGRREVDVALPGSFAIDPRIKGAIKAIAGVAEVQDL